MRLYKRGKISEWLHVAHGERLAQCICERDDKECGMSRCKEGGVLANRRICVRTCVHASLWNVVRSI